ncbi:hypothetical protein MNBD_GAMMA04-2230 [hydrothermal vent metagenome]|uniref:Uncharacterized protein n=1 Tax=hydrothermal vent metagenome TaxID=652676 RepID=A0A3B0VMX9_9ZZZZ
MMNKYLSALCLAVLVTNSALAAESVKPSPKINYADNLLMNSKTAKRLEAMESEEARLALEEARGLLEQAKVAHNSGDKAEGSSLSSLALKKFTQAAKLLPKSESALKVLRKRYIELDEEIASYLEWYDSAPYVSGDEQHAIDKAKSEVSEAKSLFEKSKYEAANKVLTRVLDDVVIMTNRSMTSSEIVSSLDFETPEQEHKYELARNNEYKRLIPIAEQQKAPKGGKLMLFKRFVKKAEEIRTQADSELQSGSIETSIKTLQNSTDQYLRALRMVGIR